MVMVNSTIKNWKNEQLSYFKEYIKAFEPGTREYTQIEKGIADLEKTI